MVPSSALFCNFESIAKESRTQKSESDRMAAHGISVRATGSASRKRRVSEMGNPVLPGNISWLALQNHPSFSETPGSPVPHNF